MLGLLPNGMEAGPPVPWEGSHPLPTKPLHPLPPQLRSLNNYVGLRAWRGPGQPQAGRQGWNRGVQGSRGSRANVLPSPCRPTD